jgi:Family of unknown function (DUF5681)
MPPIEPTNEVPADPAKRRGGAPPWQKGQSGNPKGRTRGSRNKASILAETLLNGETDRLTRQCIDSALKGEPVALRLCMDRILPPCKSRPFRFKLPALHTISDAQDALAALAAGTASGTILSDEAATLASIVASFVKTVEVSEIEARLTALERGDKALAEECRYDA